MARATGDEANSGVDRDPSSREPTVPDELAGSGRLIRQSIMAAARVIGRYCRLDIAELPDTMAEPPALVVVNHGYGGLFDLNVFALAEALRRLGADVDEPAVFLTHQMAWGMGIGPHLESAGFLPASWQSAKAGFDAGRYVIVLPGGDIDGAKPWRDRNKVKFGGRSGFAKLAIENQVPIIPVVVVGAGESLLVLTDGQGLARRLGLDRSRFRLKTMPLSLSLPWGLGVGVGAVAPYLPLPTQLSVAILDPFEPEPGEDAPALAGRVHEAMQAAADRMADGRIPVVGRPPWRH